MYRSNAIIQIIEEDRVSDVLGESAFAKDEKVLSKETELLKSDVLFQNVISNLNLETSIFAEGEILTQDLYKSAPFEIIIYEIKDSSIYNKRIDMVVASPQKLKLLVDNKSIGSCAYDSHIVNRYFDIYIRSINKNNIAPVLNASTVYFKINKRETLINDLKSYLNVSVVDENAKTIEISFEYFNPRLCYDIVDGVLNEYLEWERDTKQTKANKTIDFIDSQLDSLSKVLKLSKDSLNN